MVKSGQALSLYTFKWELLNDLWKLSSLGFREWDSPRVSLSVPVRFLPRRLGSAFPLFSEMGSPGLKRLHFAFQDLSPSFLKSRLVFSLQSIPLPISQYFAPSQLEQGILSGQCVWGRYVTSFTLRFSCASRLCSTVCFLYLKKCLQQPLYSSK